MFAEEEPQQWWTLLQLILCTTTSLHNLCSLWIRWTCQQSLICEILLPLQQKWQYAFCPTHLWHSFDRLSSKSNWGLDLVSLPICFTWQFWTYSFISLPPQRISSIFQHEFREFHGLSKFWKFYWQILIPPHHSSAPFFSPNVYKYFFSPQSFCPCNWLNFQHG